MKLKVIKRILFWFKKSFLALQTWQDRVPPTKKFLIFLVSLPLIFLWILFLFLGHRFQKTFGLISETPWGFRMKFQSLDMIESYVFLFEIWEPDITVFVRRRLKPGDLFVDIGANLGYYAFLGSSLVEDRGRVIAIEASPKIFSGLQENVELNNGCSNLKLMNLAATDVPGTVKIYAGPYTNIGLTTGLKSRRFPLEAEVEGQPIANFLNEEDLQKVRLIKIDVEGMEEKVVLGLKGLLKNLPKDVEILIELSPRWWSLPKPTIEEVIQPFTDFGFFPYHVPNCYFPWRYLWPNHVERPKRIRGSIRTLIGQIDLVLSRRDAEEL